MDSPFLAVPESDWIASNALAFAILDRYPVSPGHALVVPRRLVPTWFDATLGEAFVLARRPDGDWTYLGVARQAAEAWHIESVDDATWRAWGEGSSSA